MKHMLYETKISAHFKATTILLIFYPEISNCRFRQTCFRV